MKRLFESLAWYCASCLRIAASRALFVPALPQVYKTLCHPDHEKVVRVLGVVLCQLSQDRSQSRIVCACPQQAETKDSVVCHLGIGVMAELAQSVKDGHLRVRDGDQSEGKRNGAADDLSHRNQPNSKDSHSLLPGKIKWTLFFLFLVFSLLVPILLLPVLFVVLLLVFLLS